MNALAEFFSGLGGLLKGDPDTGDVYVNGTEKGGPARGGAEARRRRRQMLDALAAMDQEDMAITGKVAKLDAERRLVFGWASVVNKNGEVVTDSQGDQIDAADLEEAVYEFVLHKRVAGEMHKQVATDASLVESVMLTAEKIAAMGLPDTTPHGWWLGFRLEPDLFAKVKDGSYPMFSIGGLGKREAIDG